MVGVVCPPALLGCGIQGRAVGAASDWPGAARQDAPSEQRGPVVATGVELEQDVARGRVQRSRTSVESNRWVWRWNGMCLGALMLE